MSLQVTTSISLAMLEGKYMTFSGVISLIGMLIFYLGGSINVALATAVMLFPYIYHAISVVLSWEDNLLFAHRNLFASV